MAPDRLGSRALTRIRDIKRREELLLSTISVWEVCKLVEYKRLQITCDALSWVTQALAIPGLRKVELTSEISYQSTTLPGEFHRDPADQIIVATARTEGALILTNDKLIQRYDQVRCEW